MSRYTLKSPRCGRCTEPIPEDTSSFCKFCGVPFFKVPPTTDFHLIAEEDYRRTIRKQHAVAGLFAVLLTFATASVIYMIAHHHQAQQIASLKAFPKIRFFYFDFPEFPTLTRNEKTEASYVAVQAFEDHFSLKIDEYEIKHNEVPAELNFLSTGYFSDLSTFTFWDERVFEKNVPAWIARERNTLDVLISNFPIYLGESKKIESRHLTRDKLISGLGHPSLVVATSYRILNQLKDTSAREKARHLGEYVLAHELGHGLLGISDYVINNEPVFLRGPASTSSTSVSAIKQTCLMHTDAGGGALAWDHIRKRKLGTTAPCSAYQSVISANQLRAEAIALAKSGHQKEASETMSVALKQLKAQKEFSRSWVRALWEKELGYMQASF